MNRKRGFYHGLYPVIGSLLLFMNHRARSTSQDCNFLDRRLVLVGYLSAGIPRLDSEDIRKSPVMAVDYLIHGKVRLACRGQAGAKVDQDHAGPQSVGLLAPVDSRAFVHRSGAGVDRGL